MDNIEEKPWKKPGEQQVSPLSAGLVMFVGVLLWLNAGVLLFPVCHFYESIGSVLALKHQVALVQVPTFQNTLTTALMRTPGRPTVGNR